MPLSISFFSFTFSINKTLKRCVSFYSRLLPSPLAFIPSCLRPDPLPAGSDMQSPLPPPASYSLLPPSSRAAVLLAGDKGKIWRRGEAGVTAGVTAGGSFDSTWFFFSPVGLFCCLASCSVGCLNGTLWKWKLDCSVIIVTVIIKE